jgi:hypothetical protein
MTKTEIAASRRTITTVGSYAAAERAVDWLSDHNFPVDQVTIVGTGLRFVEQVTGRLTTGRAAAYGTAGGALLGLFWSLLFGVFFSVDSGSFFGVPFYSLAVGIVFGTLFGALAHVLSGGRRDFESVAETRADRYEVQVDDSLAEAAERLLAQMPAHPTG